MEYGTREKKQLYSAYEDLNLTSFIRIQSLRWLDHVLRVEDFGAAKNFTRAYQVGCNREEDLRASVLANLGYLNFSIAHAQDQEVVEHVQQWWNWSTG